MIHIPSAQPVDWHNRWADLDWEHEKLQYRCKELEKEAQDWYQVVLGLTTTCRQTRDTVIELQAKLQALSVPNTESVSPAQREEAKIEEQTNQ